MDTETKALYAKKREFLLKTLKGLFDDWEDARDTYNLVSSADVDPEFIDEVIEMLDEASQSVESDEKKEKLFNTQKQLKKSKEEEGDEHEEEIKDAEKLIDKI